MWETGKTIQVTGETKIGNLVTLGVNETHRLHTGEKRLASSKILLYSDHEEYRCLAHTSSYTGTIKKSTDAPIAR